MEYRLTARTLYLGERMKGSIFKPCIKTIPFSQISGALNARFGLDNVKAVGCLVDDPGFNKDNYLVYAPRDRGSAISRLPLQAGYLSDVLGKVYVLMEEKSTGGFPGKFELVLGGLRSRGFGACTMERVQVLHVLPRRDMGPGILNVRIPIEEQETFSLIKVIRPIYGYLFKPTPGTLSGNYVLSLFEGSEVVAPLFLLKDTRR